mgnify:CR=1 FL=1
MPDFLIKKPNGEEVLVTVPPGKTRADAVYYQKRKDGIPKITIKGTRGASRTGTTEEPGFMDQMMDPTPGKEYPILYPWDKRKNKFVPSMIMQEVADVGQGFQKLLQGKSNFNEIADTARGTAGIFTGTGVASNLAPKLAAPASSIAMNAMPPSVKAAAKTVVDKAAAPLTNRTNPDQAIPRILLERIQQTFPSLPLPYAVAQAERVVKGYGGQGTLADIGESTVALADNMASLPGQTKQLAADTLGARSGSQGSRLVGDLKKNFTSKNFYDEKKILKEAEAESFPIFKQAYDENPSVWSEGLQLLLDQEPLVMQGIKRGLEIERIKASEARKVFNGREYGVVQFNAAGDPIVGEITPLRLWHSAKRGLDDILEESRDKVTGKLVLDQKGKAILGLRKSLDAELKDLTGGEAGKYAKANAKFAGPAQLNDALHLGRAFGRGDEEVIESVFKNFTKAEQEMYRSGVVQEMAAKIRVKGTVPQTLKNALNDTGMRAKLKIIAPTEKQFKKFINSLKSEVEMQNNANRIGKGSQTFQRLGEAEEMALDNAAEAGGVLFNIMRGKVGAAISQTTRLGLNQLRKLAVPESLRDQLGKQLLSQDPQEQAAAFRAMRQYMNANRKAKAKPGRTPKKRTPNSALFEALESGRIS